MGLLNDSDGVLTKRKREGPRGTFVNTDKTEHLPFTNRNKLTEVHAANLQLQEILNNKKGAQDWYLIINYIQTTHLTGD